MSRFDPRSIICAFKNYEELKARYPKRKVIPDVYATEDFFYYFASNRRVRQVNMNTGHIYVTDQARGFPHMNRVR